MNILNNKRDPDADDDFLLDEQTLANQNKVLSQDENHAPQL